MKSFFFHRDPFKIYISGGSLCPYEGLEAVVIYDAVLLKPFVAAQDSGSKTGLIFFMRNISGLIKKNLSFFTNHMRDII